MLIGIIQEIGVIMEANRYVLTIEKNNKVWLINLINGIVVCLDCSFNEIVKEKKYDLLDDDVMKILVDKGFIVESAKVLSNIDFASRIGINLNITNECNFNCQYCYFKANNQERSFKAIDEEGTLDWFDKYILPQKQDVYVNYLGGEPLLELPRLLRISRSIQERVKRIGVKYDGEITTNGFFLTEERAKELVSSGIRCIQISLDGDREIHNQSRRCVDGTETYDIILDNISRCKDIIPIIVRINVHKKNRSDRIKRLLGELKERHIENIYFSCIEKNYGDELECNDDYVLDEKESIEEYKRLWSIQKEYEFPFIQLLPSVVGNCIAKNPNGYTINYDGNMYLCPSTCGIDKYLVDNVYEYKMNLKKQQSLLNKCKKCNVFPICMGGCIVTNCQVTLKGETVKQADNCRKEYILKMLKVYFCFKYSI